MINIKLTEQLKHSSSADKRNIITSDETWAFTERPKTDQPDEANPRIEAHDLFNLFTASIIKAKTHFIR